MTWVFQSPWRSAAGRCFSRPLLEVLEDRLAPGDALRALPVTATCGSEQPRLALAGCTATDGQDRTWAHRLANMRAGADSIAPGRPLQGCPESLARTGAPAMAVSPLVADLVFTNFGEPFLGGSDPRRPAPPAVHPSETNRCHIAADAPPTPPRLNAAWLPAPSLSVEPVAGRVGPVIVPPAAPARAAGTTGPAELVKVPVFSGVILHAGQQTLGATAIAMVATRNSTLGNSTDQLAATATGLPSFEAVVGRSNPSHRSIEMVASLSAGLSPSFEAFVQPAGSQASPIAVSATLPIPGGPLAVSSGLAAATVPNAHLNSVAMQSCFSPFLSTAAPGNGLNGDGLTGAALTAPVWGISNGTPAVTTHNGHAAQAVGGPVMSLAQRKALALGLRYLNPQMTDEAIAQAAGVSRRTLLRWAQYNALKKAQRGVFNLPRRYKTAAGDVEAWTDED